MANNVARLGVVLGLNTAEFIAGIENASKKLDQFARSVDQYAKYGATALAAMSVAALKFADDIADVADANEVAIDTVVKLRVALDASGGSADKAGVMLSAFTKFIDTAAEGSFEAQKAFKSVGVSLKDIGSMTQEQLLSKVLSGLEQMEDTVTRNARAMDFFSKAAKGVAFDKFAQEMSNTTALTKEQIEAVKAGAETWDNLQKIISKVQLLFVNAIGPSLKAINSEISDQTFPKIQMLGNAFNFLASNVNSAYKAMQSVAILLEKIAGYSVIMQTYGESNEGSAQLKKLDEETNRRLAELRNQQAEFDKVLNGTQQGTGSGRGMLGYEKYLPKSKKQRDTTEGVDTKLQSRLAYEAKLLQESHLQVVKLMDEHEKFADRILTLKENERKLMQQRVTSELQEAAQANETIMNLQKRAVLDAEQLDRQREFYLLNLQNKNLTNSELEYAKNILDIRNKYADEEKVVNQELRQGTQEYEAAMQRINSLRQQSIDQAREVLEVTRQSREGTMTEGFTKGFDEFVKDMPTRMELGKTAFNSLIGSMDNALRQFVRTGKLNFADLIRSMVQELMYLESKAKLMDIMKSLKGSSGGGIMGMLGGLMGGGEAPVMLASGGPLDANQLAIVGEQGPELFMPSGAGTIIPTNNLASALGGGGQTINYNGPYIASMSAIDTQTGVQFLAKNKQTIWASYQSANRSVPVSR